MPWVSRPPSPEIQAKVDLFNTFRGGYLSAFAQMEFTVGRLLSRFNSTDPFSGALNEVKFRFESRVDTFEEFFISRPELQNFTADALELCTGLRERYDLRNFLAHGIVRFDAETDEFTVRRILPSQSDPWQEVSLVVPFEVVAGELSKMSLFCQRFMFFAREVSETYQLDF